jgi:predicted nucleic acid-binding Zn finger protein
MLNAPYKGRLASFLNLLNDPYQGRQQLVKFGSIFCTPSLCTVKYFCVVGFLKVRAYLLSETFCPCSTQTLPKVFILE